MGRRWKRSTWGDYYYNGIDRKDNVVGYLVGNCLPCCGMCNETKGKKSYDEFVKWLGQIATHRALRGKIFVLVGMIASGKSTYCRNAARARLAILNDDAIVNMLHGEDYTLYDEKLKVLYKSIENHVVGTTLAMGRIIVVDRGLNIDPRGRARWIALANSFDTSCEAIVFDREAPEVHAERRTKGDARGRTYDYWLEVAQEHNARWVQPNLDEGFAAVHHISFAEITAGKVIT